MLGLSKQIGEGGGNTYFLNINMSVTKLILNVFAYRSFSQHGDQLDEDRPYVKKPLNAFMLFRKEQRPIVMDETKIRDSASINAIVGKKVSG